MSRRKGFIERLDLTNYRALVRVPSQLGVEETSKRHGPRNMDQGI